VDNEDPEGTAEKTIDADDSNEAQHIQVEHPGDLWAPDTIPDEIIGVVGTTTLGIPGVQDELPGVQDELPGVQDELPGVQDELPGVKDELPGVQDKLPGVEVSTRRDL
jgi:hypothetical protein